MGVYGKYRQGISPCDILPKHQKLCKTLLLHDTVLWSRLL